VKKNRVWICPPNLTILRFVLITLQHMGFGKCRAQLFGDKPTHIQNRDVIIIALVQKMLRQLLCTCSLGALEDHGVNLLA
jgi:hypothetical protein